MRMAVDPKSAKLVRIRGWRPSDAATTAVVWRQALLDRGLTSHGKVGNHRSENLQRNVADTMCRLHAKSRSASFEARQLRQETMETLQGKGLNHVYLQLGRPTPDAEREIKTLSSQLQSYVIDQWSRSRKLWRKRLWVALVAEVQQPQDPLELTGPPSEWIVAGYVVLSLTQPLAILPPPFPSSTSLYFHIDGLAVLPSMQRRGIGTALLKAAERRARIYNRKSLWLHVDPRNEPAQQLYRSEGFSFVTKVGWPWQRQMVMRKILEGVANQQPQSAGPNFSEDTAQSSMRLVNEQTAQERKTYNWGSEIHLDN